MHLTLAFDAIVISVILNLCCNLHNASNHCAKYEHPKSKHEIGVCVTSHKTDRYFKYI